MRLLVAGFLNCGKGVITVFRVEECHLVSVCVITNSWPFRSSCITLPRKRLKCKLARSLVIGRVIG